MRNDRPTEGPSFPRRLLRFAWLRLLLEPAYRVSQAFIEPDFRNETQELLRLLDLRDTGVDFGPRHLPLLDSGSRRQGGDTTRQADGRRDLVGVADVERVARAGVG